MTDYTARRMADPTDTIPPSAAAPSTRRGLTAAVGAVGAAFLASLCCAGPLLFVTLGVGAGLASTFEPLRPLFTALTVALLAVGFYVVYGKRRAAADAPVCGPNATCAVPRSRTRDEVLLWLAAAVALAFLTLPQWSVLLL
jgi:mercuric ion transport protein